VSAHLRLIGLSRCGASRASRFSRAFHEARPRENSNEMDALVITFTGCPTR
jgi:hypothetical protein